ncbi:LytR C-terminal domain-containing protein [Sinomonas sp. JGH33]|uniref:LytR C-terminal domain-containing protein n=1 Tax=Sinomonas terricola TaxID=3110330 RepID=A0ABU5T3E8_9MICC|nr:LytR C-terminal domain-containing protein [Sinomonas sp. JGH33]MEA5454187.1 LytR C-terminal domain-containing protein [Sinomonas sp. JGH33]
MSNFPRDEFDDVTETPRRQGVHRAKDSVQPPRRGVAWVIVAAAIAVVVVAAVLFIVPKYLSSTAASPAPGSQTSSSASAPSASGSPSATPSASTTPTPTPTPTPTADHTLQVGVYNATTTSGLGNRVATAARNAGWTVAAIGNWGGSQVASSVVFYRDASQKASAQALAADLGIANVQQAQQLGYPLAAVLGPGYAG